MISSLCLKGRGKGRGSKGGGVLEVTTGFLKADTECQPCFWVMSYRNFCLLELALTGGLWKRTRLCNGHNELLLPEQIPWSMCLFVLHGISTERLIQRPLSEPASPTQMGTVFIRSRTARHIESNVLLNAGGTSVGFSGSVVCASAGAGSCLCEAQALLFCLFTLHDSTGPVVASSEAQRRGSLWIKSTTMSVCQDVLNIKIGKYYLGVLLFESALSECFYMWMLFL